MDSKRLLDVSLIALTAPVFGSVLAGCLLAVRLCDGAPVFFMQERVGRDRRPFRIFKLRTMTTEADPAQRKPTRLGAWLRKRGLDEIPQFLNVLRGDMSLVGPRPLSPADAERLLAKHAPFAARFASAPGITGLAQVCQALGAERTAQLDAFYARNRSLGMDLHILLRTVLINVLGKKRGTVDARAFSPDLG
jgi:lipopolysaccharide/colanic/teichoic acid biosynthesis glycosyltransferase